MVRLYFFPFATSGLYPEFVFCRHGFHGIPPRHNDWAISTLLWKTVVIKKKDVFLLVKKQRIMCTRTIHINDRLLEQVRPVFPTDDDLQRWLEEQMESVLMSLSAQMKPEMPCSYSDEEMYSIVKERMQSLNDGTAELVDGDEVFSKIRARYGFKASVA